MTRCRWGGLDKARAVEDLAWVLVAAMKDGAPIFSTASPSPANGEHPMEGRTT